MDPGLRRDDITPGEVHEFKLNTPPLWGGIEGGGTTR